MTAWGGWGPLPLRLGGSALEGWTATQHARLTADVVAAKRTSAFAIVVVDVGVSSASVLSYRGRDGQGVAQAPTVTFDTGSVTLTWPGKYTTPSGREIFRRIYDAKGAAASAAPGVVKITSTTPVSVTFEVVHLGTDAAIQTQVTLRVMSDEPPPHIGHYGGSLGKRDEPDFGGVPAAYSWFLAIQDQRGSAFTDCESGLQFAKDFAYARMFADISQAAEKVKWNTFPGTADERLGYHVRVLSVTPRVDEPEESVRRRAAAKFIGLSSNSPSSIEKAITTTLGDGLQEIYRPRGPNFQQPPFGAWHPVLSPGPTELSIGPTSAESPKTNPVCSILVRLDRAFYGTTDAMLSVAAVDLTEVMESILPAHMNWRWGLNDPDVGFQLDVDELDLNWLTEV